MMGIYIEKYRWVVFTLQRSDKWRPKFESWGGGDDGRITIRMFGKEFIYSAEWSKYPPETHPTYEPLRDAPREITKYLRKKLKGEKKNEPGIWQRLRRRMSDG